MLHELRIENLLLIERAELRFAPGLNVITGETGAGKTILAHSLDLLLGGRARPRIVRPGAREAWVEGTLALPTEALEDGELRDLAERLPEGATEVVLGRRVSASGRTSAFVQGRAASAAELRALGQRLLSFYGQHEHRRLTLSSVQLEVLDGFAGPEQIELRARYRVAHGEVVALTRELEVLRERDGARERDLDLLRYELEEIEAAGPDPAEEEELSAERGRLQHVERLRFAAGGALIALAGADEDGGGASAALGAAGAGLGDAAGLDPRLDALAARVTALLTESTDLASDLRGYLEEVDADPERLEAVEERLESLDRLKRKHGGSIESVLAHADHCRTEIARLEGAAERCAELEARLARAIELRAKLGERLTSARERAAAALEKRVSSELGELAMDGATVEVVLDPHPEGYGWAGRETVEFLIATNPGIEVSPLREAASGGELSRVMLALTRLGSAGSGRTLAFDEIDSGIGGKTATAVGERLRAVGRERQVICITHLPRIASLADAHFRVVKRTAGDTAIAEVERVEGEDLVAEIRRMLGGSERDEAATRHARELLAAA